MKTVEQWEQHSLDLDKDETLYGRGPVAGYEIDLAFGDNGKDDSWGQGTDFFRSELETRGWEEVSSGTGFGLRDMQFIREYPFTEPELQRLIEKAKDEGINVAYLNQHGTNEWGEQLQEDAAYTFGYDKKGA